MLRSDHSAFFKLLVLVNLTARPFARLFEGPQGLALAEWRVLLTLAARPGISAVEVADALGLDKMAVSRSVRALEHDGRVSRQIDARDQRRVALRLTADGQAVFDIISPSAIAREAELFGALDEGELHAFTATLDKLIARARALPGDDT